MANIFDCKTIADLMIQDVAEKVKTLNNSPFLVGVRLDGENGPSMYANGIKKDCKKCGILYSEYLMDKDDTIEGWNKRIAMLNQDNTVDGVIIFTPCPDITQRILPEKDVDARDSNLYYEPCTPSAAIKVLLESNIEIAGKYAIVIGRSNTVGKPMARLLLDNDATVTICHSKVDDISKYCRDADIIISATGIKDLVTCNMVKGGAAVIDVSRIDTKFDEVDRVAGIVTSQKNGLGLVTRAVLMEHVLNAAMRKEM